MLTPLLFLWGGASAWPPGRPARRLESRRRPGKAAPQLRGVTHAQRPRRLLPPRRLDAEIAPAALGAARLARSPLFGIRPDNPAVLLLSLAVLVLAGLGAGLAPPTAPPPSTRSRPCAQNDDS